MTTAEIVSVVGTVVALVAASAAWGAIIANRRTAAETIRAQVNIAARSSRAAVVSANRQRWIDAIREDVAAFISARSRLGSLSSMGSSDRAGQDALLTEERDLRASLVTLHARIEMRLNHTEDDHLSLIEAIRRYDESCCQESETALRVSARKIFKDEWTRLKKEAAGIDPFVREAVPPRRI